MNNPKLLEDATKQHQLPKSSAVSSSKRLNLDFKAVVTSALAQDEETVKRLRVCLQWILFAACPLEPQELYFAIQLSLNEQFSNQDQDSLKRFVTTSSGGLAKVTGGRSPKVQFINQSLATYLLEDDTWSGIPSNLKGHSHKLLKNVCIAQLNASKSQEIPSPQQEVPKTIEWRNTISSRIPLVVYSVLHVLHHANSAEHEKIELADNFASFPLQRWIALYNSLEKYAIRRYKPSVSALYIFADKNLAELIRTHPKRASCFEIEDERYGPPFLAALASGSYEAICMFLEIQAGNSASLSMLYKNYQNSKPREVLRPDFRFSRKRTILSYLAEYGNKILISFLIELGKYELDCKDDEGRTPLSWAAEKGHKAVVELLISTGKVEPDLRDCNGRTPLSWAAKSGQAAIIQLLLNTGKVEVNSEENDKRTPLYLATEGGKTTIVQLLLKTGKVKPDIKDDCGRTPLYWAAQKGMGNIVQLLLGTGMVDPDSKDQDGRTPLSWAAQKGMENIVQLLLETGMVDPDLKDRGGQSPLDYAEGNPKVLNLLLEYIDCAKDIAVDY